MKQETEHRIASRPIYFFDAFLDKEGINKVSLVYVVDQELRKTFDNPDTARTMEHYLKNKVYLLSDFQYESLCEQGFSGSFSSFEDNQPL